MFRKVSNASLDEILPREKKCRFRISFVNGNLMKTIPTENYKGNVWSRPFGSRATFGETPGVFVTAVGYAGGSTPNPTLRVCSGLTGHNEVVRVVFDPAKANYEQLLKKFWEGTPTQGMHMKMMWERNIVQAYTYFRTPKGRWQKNLVRFDET